MYSVRMHIYFTDHLCILCIRYFAHNIHTSTVGFPLESMMYLPFTPVTADMWRASTGLAARAAALDIVESILVFCFLV